ncbi:hypothetical protein BZG36_03875 [Bifiguratus adelaidae]|uniref:Uncharacterized protein n=1 Tax=Bifiguratus adelaidae TaxID=1938954 RepID=A0A261XXS5_9FUNG|nr:hypothetical protein BZG36_03875 [Bifiguratus adelaidae]
MLKLSFGEQVNLFFGVIYLLVSAPILPRIVIYSKLYPNQRGHCYWTHILLFIFGVTRSLTSFFDPIGHISKVWVLIDYVVPILYIGGNLAVFYGAITAWWARFRVKRLDWRLLVFVSTLLISTTTVAAAVQLYAFTAKNDAGSGLFKLSVGTDLAHFFKDEDAILAFYTTTYLATAVTLLGVLVLAELWRHYVPPPPTEAERFAYLNPYSHPPLPRPIDNWPRVIAEPYFATLFIFYGLLCITRTFQYLGFDGCFFLYFDDAVWHQIKWINLPEVGILLLTALTGLNNWQDVRYLVERPRPPSLQRAPTSEFDKARPSRRPLLQTQRSASSHRQSSYGAV